MSLGPRDKTVRIADFRDSETVADQIQKIKDDTGANHTDVMRELVRLGLKHYKSINL